MQDSDDVYMARALALAERGRGLTSPNPMVGAVVIDGEGVVVGRGAHLAAGGPHAEVHALRDAGSRARGATLYCTLEPCSHVGRTGPCAPLVADAGIRRAVIAMEDPNPLVAGGGIALLRRRGVEVTVGVARAEAAMLNPAFLAVMTRRRPFVTLKAALSADYAIAARPGAPTRLTGPAADRYIHRDRAEVDALGVGTGTMLADDPRLTPRIAYRQRPLARVIFDRRLRTPPAARVFSTLDAGPVIIVCTPNSVEDAPDRARALVEAGAIVEPVDGRAWLARALETLAGRGLTSLIVEGGVVLHRAFWDAGLADRVQMYITPRQLGDGCVPWMPLPVVRDGPLTDVSVRVLGEDVLIEGYVHRPD